MTLRLSAAQVFAKALIGTCLLSIAGCAQPPGPSIPQNENASLAEAKAALKTCSSYANSGGNAAVVANYAAGAAFGGVVVGPIIVASNHHNIRRRGEAGAVDNCLERYGFTRRELSEGELHMLNRLGPYGREKFLGHLIGGGTLETYVN